MKNLFTQRSIIAGAWTFGTIDEISCYRKIFYRVDIIQRCKIDNHFNFGFNIPSVRQFITL